MPRKKTTAKTKTNTKRKYTKRKPHLVATPEEGYEKQVGLVIDERFYDALRSAAKEKGTNFSALTRKLQEAWLARQV